MKQILGWRLPKGTGEYPKKQTINYSPLISKNLGQAKVFAVNSGVRYIGSRATEQYREDPGVERTRVAGQRGCGTGDDSNELVGI